MAHPYHLGRRVAMVAACLVSGVAAQPVQTLFSNENGSPVTQGGAKPTTFTLSEPAQIPFLRVYQYNGGRPPAAGTINILNAKGQTIGSWQAVSHATYYWSASPNLVFDAGTYTVTVSSMGTWACNAQSGGQGFLLVHGIALGTESKGAVRSIFAQETARVEQDQKGVVAPLFFGLEGTDAMGTRWVVRRTNLKVGEELQLEVFASPASEIFTILGGIDTLYRIVDRNRESAQDDKAPWLVEKLPVRVLPQGTRTHPDGKTTPEARLVVPFRTRMAGSSVLDIRQPVGPPPVTYKTFLSVAFKIMP